MIYMVEQALSDPSRRAAWDAWYLDHMRRLLTIPGIRATQRFGAIHDAASPFVALHEVESPAVFESQAYQNAAGPANTGIWRAVMVNWHRNLFVGVDHTPEVPGTALLLVVEDGYDAPAPLHWLDAIGLDRSVARRAIGVVPRSAASLAGAPGLRVCEPLTPRMSAVAHTP